MKMLLIKLAAAMTFGALLFACGGQKSDSAQNTQPPQSMLADEEQGEPAAPMSLKGVGPVQHVELAGIDPAMVEEGKRLFGAKCSACHKIGEEYIGPDLKGITTRRSPEWIMNMMLNPENMVKEDPIAKELVLKFNGTLMVNQGLTKEEARKILEYFRTQE
ncbi:mono/diheme cytochrome c family protein [Thermonema lapsum]|uniref:Mono/diheme cytochrome c family protein n=1 Tax=Thermonema lapsum TaxID=28195 RepID=A0A846MRV0_9BACT|nr:cytochrome c [Thermonema lapsum]NIK74283.1 mono/diheme cytochrome c family protein [Thermonema lapsum]